MRLRLFRDRSRGSVNAPRAPGPAARITLRLATPEDGEAIARLADLYDRPLPSGALLLAEVDGELQAALTLTGAQELMEPYLPTAALVELLALRVEHLRDQMTPAELAEATVAADSAVGHRRPTLRNVLGTQIRGGVDARCHVAPAPPSAFGSVDEEPAASRSEEATARSIRA